VLQNGSLCVITSRAYCSNLNLQGQRKMPITAKQLEELEGVAESVERIDEAVNALVSYIAQQFEKVAQEAFSGIAQQFEESNKAAWSHIAQQLGAVNTDYFTGFIQEALQNLGRYSGPAFTPPPLYARQLPPQLPPQVKFIDGEYVYEDDYKPGLN